MPSSPQLVAGSTVRACILCTHRGATSAPPLDSKDVRFYRGFLPDVDLEPMELLREPPALLSK